jgi:gentisate 1,2-dioxygenase
VSGEGQQQQATPLADYAQQHWADFLPALSAQQQQQPPQGGGVTYPRQQGGGQPATSSPVGAYFQRAYGKKE